MARYPNALPDVTVAAAAASDGVEEALTLASPAAPSRFVYTLATSGLRARANAHGGIDFLDGSGNLQFAFLAPVMEDAAHARSGALTLSLGQDASGQTVSLAADAAWLASSARRYPVVVDPDLVTTTGDSQDCPLDSANPTTSSCGNSSLAAGANGSEVARSLLQFPLALRGEVLGATLGLYQLAAGNATPVTLELHQVTRPWTTAATWTTADGSTPWTTPGGDFVAAPASTATDAGTAANGTWLTFTPGALAAGWNDGSLANDGVLVKTANEGTTQYVDVCPGGGRGAVNGCTAAEEPYLAVTWTDRLGERPSYPLLSFGLTDRMGLEVNVANGNLLLHAHDVGIAGTGLPLVVDRLFNDLGADQGDTNELGPGWVHTTGSDVWLDLGAASDGVVYHGVGGSALFYQRNPDGSYATPPGEDATLVKHGDGSFTLTGHGSGVRFQFDAAGNLTAEQDRNGNTLAFAYNNDGPHSTHTITDTQGRVLSFSYTNPSFPTFVTQIADWTGRTWQYGDDAAGELTSYTDPANQLTRYAYSNGDLTQITDPLGNVTTLTYQQTNPERVTSITFGAGTSVAATYQFTYNTGNTVVTDPNSHQTTYSYDGQRRQTKVVDALANTFQWAWTSDNHVQTYTDGKNQAFTSVYDDTANPPLCSTQVGTHNLCSASLPTGATTRWSYSDSSHPSYPTTVTDPQGNQVTSHYTPAGNPDTVTDQLPSQNQTQVVYNANGNLTKITPPSYTPGTGSQALGPTLIVPDVLSRTSGVTDGKGTQHTFTFDPLDRVTALSYPSYTAGNVDIVLDADGNVTQMTDSPGATTYQYDARNRQTRKTLPATLGGGYFAYGYDPASNLTAFTDAATAPGQAPATDYHYNSGDELDWLQEPGGAQTTFQSDPDHRRTSTAYPNGVTMAQTYDIAGRLSAITATRASDGAVLSSYSYAYNKPNTTIDTGLVQTITENDAPGVGPYPTRHFTTSQAYDQLDRLTSWVVTQSGNPSPLHNYSYQYDGLGNRTQIVADPVAGTPHSNESDLTFNAADEIDHIQAYGSTGTNPATVDYWYDAAGNQTGNQTEGSSQTGQRIAYLPTNQVQSVTDVYGHAATMTWAGAGQSERTSADWSNMPNGDPGPPAKPAEFGHTTYTNSALGLSGYTNSNGATYVTLDPSGLPLAERRSGGTVYHVFDGLGNVVMLTGSGGSALVLRDLCPTGNSAGNAWAATGYADDGVFGFGAAAGMAVDVGSKEAFGFGGFWDTNGSGRTQLPICGIFGFLPFCAAPVAPSTQEPLQAEVADNRMRVQLQVDFDTIVLTDGGSGRGVTGQQVRDALVSVLLEGKRSRRVSGGLSG